MAAKKKIKKDLKVLMEEDDILVSLKERYFKLLKTEDIGKTPKLTSTIDKLEETINKRIQELS